MSALYRPTDPQLLDAQWALVSAVEQAVASSASAADLRARYMAAELLHNLRRQAATPQAWATLLAHALLAGAAEALAHRHSLAAQRTQLETLQARLAQLQAPPDAHSAAPPADRVPKLMTDLARAQADAARLGDRVRALETALADQAQTYEVAIARLQAQIADLNRIIADQQRRLNDLLAPAE